MRLIRLRLLRRRLGRLDRDRGSVTLMILAFVLVIMVGIGLAWDGGNRMRTIERADNLAGEAARAGGQAINLSAAVGGAGDIVDPARARQAALAYLHDAGADGTVSVDPAGHELTVTVQIVYRPVFLGLIGIKPRPETGTATAVLLTGP